MIDTPEISKTHVLPTPFEQNQRRRPTIALLGGILGCVFAPGLFLGVIHYFDAVLGEPVRVSTPPTVFAERHPDFQHLTFNPLRAMQLRPAEEADLTPETEVIGVVVEGTPRAYVTKYLEFPDHVYNDKISGREISVTFCERTGCARVLERNEKDNVTLGGWSGIEMLLFVNGDYWPQGSDGIPLEDFPFQFTTWGDWLQHYPNSMVYAGDGGRRKRWFGDGPIPDKLMDDSTG